ncbi:MAG TPA: ATP-binding protein [Thermoprotei archaeon]|nr:ATP-binding protein [Thermoprotei archaeon]
MHEKAIAQVCGGSSTKGISAKLLPPFSCEDISVGESILVRGRRDTLFLTIVGEIQHFEGENYASMLTKIRELSDNPEALKYIQDSSVGEILSSKISLIPIALSRQNNVSEADTIPDFLCYCFKPEEKHIKIFYGEIDYKASWPIGYPKAQKSLKEIFIPVNIDALLRNSFAIYGKSGTGKTYMGNILATFIVGYNYCVPEEEKVSMLIFDLHSEYSLYLLDPTGKPVIEGVAKAFDEDFVVYTIDKEFTTLNPDARLLKISAKNITIEDLVICSEALGLTERFSDYAYSIEAKLRHRTGLKPLELILTKDYHELDNILKGSLDTYERNVMKANIPKLKRLAEYPFITLDEEDTLSEVLESLVRGKSIAIAFGAYENDSLAYLIVANVLARRIWTTYRELGLRKGARRRLVIFLEEAHKFLSKDVYFKTPFGKIARELRKRGVVLAIIDQRPSELDPDVRAMLWNKIVFNLSEKGDIREACMGLPHKELFEPLVETLKRGEALVFGSAISFPAVIKVMDYKKVLNIVRNVINKIKEEREYELEREKGEISWG